MTMTLATPRCFGCGARAGRGVQLVRIDDSPWLCAACESWRCVACGWPVSGDERWLTSPDNPTCEACWLAVDLDDDLVSHPPAKVAPVPPDPAARCVICRLALDVDAEASARWRDMGGRGFVCASCAWQVRG